MNNRITRRGREQELIDLNYYHSSGTICRARERHADIIAGTFKERLHALMCNHRPYNAVSIIHKFISPVLSVSSFAHVSIVRPSGALLLHPRYGEHKCVLYVNAAGSHRRTP